MPGRKRRKRSGQPADMLQDILRRAAVFISRPRPSILLLTIAVLQMAACATPPVGNQSFSLEANYPEDGIWKMSGLERASS
jgi:uncharacterized lipoprotein YmbA